MPKISVIIPIYNVEKYLARCLDSLVKQTMQDIEFILVNDGSTDNSKYIAKQYLEKYPGKIKYLQKENGGLSDARNFGLKYAKGEYIAFLDSDDYVQKEMYENMYEIAKKNNSDMVECNFIWEYPNKKIEDIGSRYTNKNEAIVRARVVAWNKLIKRQKIEEAKIEFPKGLRYEDVEFFYKLVPYLDKISFDTNCYIHYIQRETSISNTQNIKTKDIFEVLENVINYYKERNIYEEYKDELEYIYVRYLLCSSLKRMCKIKNKEDRNKLLYKTYNNIQEKFPNWKKNKILNRDKTIKNTYIKSVNKHTFKLYCFILGVI